MQPGAYLSRLLKMQFSAGAAQASWRETFPAVVLLVDIAESSPLTERFEAEGPHGAERLNTVLDRYFGEVFDIVAAHGGDVVQVEGDAVLALWRDDRVPDDPASRAARAAIALREAFDGRPLMFDVVLRHRIALAAGPITAISFQNQGERGFLLVTGAPIHDMAELAHAGDPGEIVMTDGFAERVDAIATTMKNGNAFRRLVSLREPVTLPDSVPPGCDEPVDALAHRYVPRVVLERAAASEAGWMAEFRMLSIVYTHLSDLDLEAEDFAERIHQAIDTLQATIDPLLAGVFEVAVGDKGVIVLVAFGLPGQARENDAARALEAARRIHDGLLDHGFASSIGVSTGRAFCGDVGSRTRRHFLVSGPLMYRGARLMQGAGGGILVDDATVRAASSASHFRFATPLPIAIKGMQQPLMAHRFDMGLDAGTAQARGPKWLHGRDSEVHAFDRVLDGLAQGQGAVVAIEAESGGGKSHLLRQVEMAARARGFNVMLATASAFQTLEAYATCRSLVKRLLWMAGDPPEPPPALLRQRLVEALRGDPAEAKAALLEDILPLHFKDDGLAAQISGQARLAGLEDLLAALLIRAAADAPLVLAVDDLHWIDQPSAQLMLGLCKRLPHLLWVLASRPLDGNAAPHGVQLFELARPRLSLARLPMDSIQAIVADLLGVPAVAKRLVEFIHRRCEGLPFHAVQLTLALLERGVLAVRDGKVRIVESDLESSIVPTNVRDLIVSRLDGLAPSHLMTAKVASVIGRSVSIEVVRAIYPLAVADAGIDAMLKDLVTAAILEADPQAEGAYVFQHAIIQEVTYDLLTLRQRQPLHRQLAGFIEQRHAGELEAHFAELAHHWELATEFDSAVRYRQLAATFAVERSANHDALNHIAHLQRVAAHARLALPAQQQAELARLQGDACHELSRFEEAHSWFGVCATLNEIRVPASRAAITASLAVEVTRQLLHRSGLTRQHKDAALRARDRLSAHIFTRRAERAYFRGDAIGLLHDTLTSLNRAERAASVAEMVEGLGGLAIGFGTAGLHRVAGFYRRRSIALAEEAGSLHDQGFAHLLAAVYTFQAGHWPEMDLHCNTGAAIYQRIGDRFRFQSCRVIQAYSDLLRGDYGKAEATLRSFGEEAEQVENVPVRAWVLCGLALLDMQSGRDPVQALRRIALVRNEALHRAERLLCDGIEAAAWMQAGNAVQALRAATTALDNMLESAPTMGIALLSVAAVAEVHLALAQGPAQAHVSLNTRMDPARVACRAAARFASKIMIFKPRERLLRGRLALASGHPDEAASHWRRGLSEAAAFSLPLEEALCHLALAGVAASPTQRREHQQRGGAILERLGADPWMLAAIPPATNNGETTAPGGDLESQTQPHGHA
ncbi:AAA family ATPase [Variovorax rhizosphaerae]|uniref:AAA family ATPase n=1 Tax=Variovorax rhizosphaerae TaxID=1836200 RepID=A0ABU8WYC5_9BURK